MMHNLRDERITECEVMSGPEWLALPLEKRTEIVTRHSGLLRTAIHQATEANLGFIVEMY